MTWTSFVDWAMITWQNILVLYFFFFCCHVTWEMKLHLLPSPPSYFFSGELPPPCLRTLIAPLSFSDKPLSVAVAPSRMKWNKTLITRSFVPDLERRFLVNEGGWSKWRWDGGWKIQQWLWRFFGEREEVRGRKEEREEGEVGRKKMPLHFATS